MDFRRSTQANRLVPPSLSSGSEIIFGPGGEGDLSVLGGITVGKGKGKRGRSTDNVSIRGVLGSVARAHELVVGGGPWDNTSQVSADCGVLKLRISKIERREGIRELLNSRIGLLGNEPIKSRVMGAEDVGSDVNICVCSSYQR